MPKIALQKANRKLVEGVQPYDRKAAKQFSMGYLSGFQAERRDLEKEAFGAEIARDTEQYAKRVLENDMRGYTTVRPVHQQVGNRQERWRYALVPVWVMTYKGKNGKIYYYTINGQNGKVCGELPVDYKKLSLVSPLTRCGIPFGTWQEDYCYENEKKDGIPSVDASAVAGPGGCVGG